MTTSNILRKTAATYGLLWRKEFIQDVPAYWHLHYIEAVVGHSIARGRCGIEVGSGCGYDTYHLARAHPHLLMLSLDISEGVFTTKKITFQLTNVRVIQGSCLSLPVKNESCDFVYSYGVLHHTPDPEKGLREIVRVLKRSAPAYLYLYESHAERPIKYYAVRIIRLIRGITIFIPKRLLYIASMALSPFCYVFFTLPSCFLMRFQLTQKLGQAFPFAFAKGPFSLTGDLYDRLGAPLEHRFSREQVIHLMRRCGFQNVRIGRIPAVAGWVVWGNRG